MSLRFFGALGLAAFTLATLGSDVVARTGIRGQTLQDAVLSHLEHAPRAAIMLLPPFALIALICALLEDKTSRRRALILFTISAMTLLYLYFTGYQAAQEALLEERWTAAAMSIGFLPYVAMLVVIATAAAGVAMTNLRR